jgi:hypothetical protein
MTPLKVIFVATVFATHVHQVAGKPTLDATIGQSVHLTREACLAALPDLFTAAAAKYAGWHVSAPTHQCEPTTVQEP